MKYLFIFTLIIGCSHSPTDSPKEKPDTDQRERKNLDLSPEVQEKFVVKEKPVTQEIKKEVPDKKNIEEKLPVKNDKTSDTRIEKAPPLNIPKVSEGYPAGFPDEYKKLDKAYKSVWSKFSPKFIKQGEKVEMRVSYLGLGMGKMFMETGPKVLVGEQEAFSFSARLKTASFYSYIYELDDKLSAQVVAPDFLPIRYSLIQRETKKEIDDIQLFDREKLMLYYRYRRWRKDKRSLTKKSEDIHIPKYSIDPFTLLYFVRGLPLGLNKKFSFPVVTRDKLWVFKLSVVKREQIKTAIGKRWAFKVNAEIGEEGSFIKKGALELWFDEGPSHMLWQLKVGTKIGSLYAKVSKYEAGQQFKD